MGNNNNKNVLLVSMPFAGVPIPSIQLAILEEYLKERDINVKSRHLYLKTAEFYHLKNYNYLILAPNDSYSAQMVFSRYVFPEHWASNQEKIKKYFNDKIIKNGEFEKDFNFETYIKRTDLFYSWIMRNVNWKDFDIIGFTLNYGQFLPSLAVAKEVKKLYPDKQIILGGSRITGDLGVRVLESFEYIDFIVSGEGEESLYLLATGENYENIPGLIYREDKKVKSNLTPHYIDLNSLPIPCFDSYFDELITTPQEVQQYFHVYGLLPIEISRGCWWNKCSFCNLNLQHKKYREKTVEKIVEEINFLSERYKILNFQFISNTLLLKNYKNLLEQIKNLGKDFSFCAETRAGRLKSDDYTLLKEAGFTVIQTGVESFSQSYLKKMNKGVRVIENIAALKFCKENHIKNNYNLIINYPNEETKDFEETAYNMQFFRQYIDMPNISNLQVVYDSPIQKNYENYNIAELKPNPVDEIAFPQEYLEKEFIFIFDFKKKKTLAENNWKHLIESWRAEREKFIQDAVKTQRDIDEHVFYFIDGGSFLKIYDKRNYQNVMVYLLDDVERDIFLSCIDVASFEEIQKQCKNIKQNQIETILKSFVQVGIVFNEDGFYLSLPLNYKKLLGIKKEPRSKENTTTTEVIATNI